MAIVIKPITVEVSKPNVFQAIAAKQNDCNSRFLKVTFVNEGEKINVIPSAKVAISAERNDGKSGSFFGEVNDDGTATLPIHSWMLELPGYVECDISIIEEDSKLTCTTFSLLVEEAAHNSGDISEDEQYDVLTQLINDTNGIENRVIAYTDATYTPITRTNALEKRVTNLEQGIVPSPFVTDDTVAYTKDVPENALPYAEVSKIGGMTRKCTNLFKASSQETQTYHTKGLTVVDDNTLSGIATLGGGESYIRFLTRYPSGTFTLNTKGNLGRKYVWAYDAAGNNISNSISINGMTYNGYYAGFYTDTYTLTIDIPSSVAYWMFGFSFGYSDGATVETISNIQISNGADVPYEPHFEGLRSAPVTEVESVGANLFDSSNIVNQTYATAVVSGDTITISGQYYAWFGVDLKAGKTYTLKYDETHTHYASIWCRYSDKSDSRWDNGTTLTPTKDVVGLYLYSGQGTSGVTVYSNVMLSEGETALPYTPYTKNTLPIPEAVRPKNGINENVYDSIEWCDDGTKKSYQRVGKADMGTLDWYNSSGFMVSSTGLANAKATNAEVAKILCAIYSNASYNGLNLNTDKHIAIREADKSVWIRDTDYTDAETFKSAMQGVMLYYELAEPVITDITNILPKDNFIGVEGNGTITLQNEYAYDVPSEITYQIKEVAV